MLHSGCSKPNICHTMKNEPNPVTEPWKPLAPVEDWDRPNADVLCAAPPKMTKVAKTLPLIDQFLTHCLCSGMKTWPGFLFKRPRNFTASWVWFWTTVWRTGSPTTPRAAGICRPSRSSPLSATLLLTQKTGGGSCPSTWCSSLKLPASHFWSSSVTRPSSTPEN